MAVAAILAWFGIRIHNLGVFLLLAVAFSVLLDSRRHWIASSVLAFTFYAGYHVFEIQRLDTVGSDVERVLSIAVGLLATVLVLSHLKRRLASALAEERKARGVAEGERQRLVDHLERITDAFFALDHEFRYTYLNSNAEEVARHPRDELLGKVVWDVFPEMRGTVFEHSLRRAMSEKHAAHFEAYFPPYDSWYENHAYPSAEGITIFVRPINDRKRAEAAAQTRARQQAAIAEVGLRSLSGHDGSLMHEVVQLMADVLEVDFVELLELTPAGEALLLVAGVGWNPGVVGSATVKSGERSQAGYTLQIGSPVVVEDLARETRFTGPDLLLDRGVTSGMTAIIGSRDRPFGVLGVHTRAPRTFSHDDSNFLQAVANILAELTERERADAALRESELRFRQLAENLDEVLFLQDAEGRRIYYVSPAYERVWGRSLDSLYEDPRSWIDSVLPEDRPRVEAALGGLGDNSLDIEYRIVRPDGATRWIHARALPVVGPGPVTNRSVGIAEDITERKEVEEQGRRLLRAEAARTEAEAAVGARKELMAVVSHDLRSPLNTVQLCSRALRTEPPEELDQLAGRIDRSVDQMLRLIADLLEFAEIDERKLPLQKQPIAVSTLFDEILESFGPEAKSRGLVLEASLEAPASSVVADHDRMVQALSNLVSNAIKFTSQGKVELRATRESGELRIAVRDTGAGIPPESLPHVFDRFWQGAADRERGSSIGLGLAIAKGIVEAHGGRIWVDTQLGSGTTFHIAIPDDAATERESAHRVIH